ncbi:MAG: ribosome silencing factor [Erysipelotrichales bacterium]|nr:ribosome silencing factor [Erysipelotrichales bacterium]
MELIDILIKAIDDKKGENIARINFQGTHAIMDDMLICDVSNNRLMMAIVDELEDVCAQNGYYECRKEGNEHSDWVLFYCNHIAVSVFLKDAREFYNIERLWQDFLVK